MELIQHNINIDQKYVKYSHQYPDFRIRNKVPSDIRNIDRGKLDEKRIGLFKIS